MHIDHRLYDSVISYHNVYTYHNEHSVYTMYNTIYTYHIITYHDVVFLLCMYTLLLGSPGEVLHRV